MAFRLMPSSSFPSTVGAVFPYVRSTTVNAFKVEGLAISGDTSLSATLHYVWQIPSVLPIGTAKVEISMVAEGTGNAIIDPAWDSVTAGQTIDYNTSSLNSEGDQTVTFVSGDIDTFKRLTVNLDATTINADEYLIMRLLLRASEVGWTMADTLLFLPTLIWE
jgi:hypothetical protein